MVSRSTLLWRLWVGMCSIGSCYWSSPVGWLIINEEQKKACLVTSATHDSRVVDDVKDLVKMAALTASFRHFQSSIKKIHQKQKNNNGYHKSIQKLEYTFFVLWFFLLQKTKL